MNLNEQKINLTMVNNANFNKVKAFATDRVTALKALLSELKKVSDAEFESVTKDSNYKEVYDNCSLSYDAINSFSASNSDKVSRVKIDLAQVEKEHLEMIDILKTKAGDTEKLKVDKNESSKIYLASIKSLEAAATSIQCEELAKIKCDDQTQLHFNKIWIWFLDVFYNTSDIKYSWENFAKNVFKTRSGTDFINRLKGVDFAKVSVYQIESAKKVSTLSSMMKQTLSNSALDKVFEYLSVFIKTAEARTIYKLAKATIAKNAVLLSEAKAKSELIEEKLKILRSSAGDCDVILNTYNEINSKIAPRGALTPGATTNKQDLLAPGTDPIDKLDIDTEQKGEECRLI